MSLESSARDDRAQKVNILKDAIEKGLVPRVKQLIKEMTAEEINYQGKNSDDTALMTASWCGNLSIVKLLVRYGALIDLKGKYEQTALMKATEMSKFDICDFLISAGANLDIKDEDGDTFRKFTHDTDKLEAAVQRGLQNRARMGNRIRIKKGMLEKKEEKVREKEKEKELKKSALEKKAMKNVVRTPIGLKKEAATKRAALDERQKISHLEKFFLQGKKLDMLLLSRPISELTGMGFTRADAIEALLASGNVEDKTKIDQTMQRAVEYLFNKPKLKEVKSEDDDAELQISKQQHQMTLSGIEMELNTRQTALQQEFKLLQLKQQQEIDEWQQNVYLWCLLGATVGGSASQKKMTQINDIKAKLNITPQQHAQCLRELGLTLEDFTRLQSTAADIDNKIQKVDKILQEKAKEQAKTGGGSTLAELTNSECVVCMDAVCDHVLLDCMHLCLCGTCASLFRDADATCPRCRTPVKQVQKLFL